MNFLLLLLCGFKAGSKRREAKTTKPSKTVSREDPVVGSEEMWQKKKKVTTKRGYLTKGLTQHGDARLPKYANWIPQRCHEEEVSRIWNLTSLSLVNGDFRVIGKIGPFSITEESIMATKNTLTDEVIDGFLHASINGRLDVFHINSNTMTAIMDDEVGQQGTLWKANISCLQIWRSTLRFGNGSSEFFMNHGEIKVVDGQVKLQLDIDEVVTLTTVTRGNKGSHPDPPPDTSFPLPYKEDFENYVEYMEPYNFAQQTGVFEVHADGNHGNVMRQMVMQIPIYWCNAERLNLAITVIGISTWSDIEIVANARLPSNASAAEGYFLAVRVNQGGCWAYQSRGVYMFVDPMWETFAVYGSIDKTVFLAKGSTGAMATHGWNTLALSVKSNWANGSVNGRMLFNVTVPEETSNGFVGLGTTSWGYADFDKIYIDNPGSHMYKTDLDRL